MYSLSQFKKQRAFSLMELVIVIVIIGIIGAIAIPRMSRGAAGAGDAALTANLAVLRNAIDLYQTEHGGAFPSGANIEAQLLTYTNDAGTPNASRTSDFIYGPYIRTIPALPVGTKKGATGITTTGPIGTDGAAWFYDPSNGTIRANLVDTEVDVRNRAYNAY